MLRSIKQLYGHSFGTAEGEIGTVKDFYFDDQQWVIRYVVADTGSWLSGRLVLISPHAIGTFHEGRDCIPVNLTRKQIEDSPAMETHKPVSRQFEEEYYRYYGWPTYWAGGGMWGATGMPGFTGFPAGVMPPPMPNKQTSRDSRSENNDDPHLRSTKALSGYHIQTSDGAIGHITDFMIDDKSWAIGCLVVEAGHWFAGKEIAISPKHIDAISHAESKVFVKETKEALLEATEYQMPPLGVA